MIYHYKKHDLMSEISTHHSMIDPLEKDIHIIVENIQNILLHQHWAKHYGLELTQAQKEEPYLRSIEEKLAFLKAKGLMHISDKQNHKDKMIGICRDFSLMGVALFREAGISARARCGFASYLDQGKYSDHWVIEYYNEHEYRWIMVDAQLDALQQSILKIDFDPFDVDPKQFIIAPIAWQHCRNGLMDPQKFGIFKWWGYDYLRCNLLLDALSLTGMTLQPWDYWDGYKSLPIEQWHESDYQVMDQLAALTLNVDQDYVALKNFIESHDKIRAPHDLSLLHNGFQ